MTSVLIIVTCRFNCPVDITKMVCHVGVEVGRKGGKIER